MSESFSHKWTRALQSFAKPILKPFLALSRHAAAHPKIYIVMTIIGSIGIMVLGLATNFVSETDDSIWTPQGSRPIGHGTWVDEDSNFPPSLRNSVLVIHRDGKNIFGDNGDLALESTRRLFEVIDNYRGTPRYDELCALSDYVPPTSENVEDATRTCQIVSAASFWNDDTALFQSEATSNEAVLNTMSADAFPYGGAVDHDQIIGYNEFDASTGILNNGQSYVIIILLPPDKEDEEDSEAFSVEFEKDVIDRILDLQDAWSAEGTDFKVELLAERSFEDEFTRALTKDLPLLPSVFILMSILCIILFSRRDRVLSRGWLGFGAVVTVLLAIIFSFGLLFLIGVPFTSLTPLLPFIMFGVGLDDAFIISGAFARTDPKKTPEERIDDTMNDIGMTILLTTATSTLAFALGAVSSIPAVRYLVMYAFPTIFIDFMFQITFFVAIIVIDQRRVDSNRRDCCFCCTARPQEDSPNQEQNSKTEQHFADRFMARYADFLLRPAIKWIVIVFFVCLLAFFSWRTSILKQYFDFTDVIPSDSYIQEWWDAYQTYYEANGVRAGVYFRDVDFSNPDIQDQMESYVQELAEMPSAGEGEPFSFWLRDFREFVDTNDDNISTLTFEEQIALFLEDPIYYDSHGEDIVLNADGVMTASRTVIRLNNVDEQDVVEVVNVLETQRRITKNQQVNQGKDDWAFFTFAPDYYIWEFYRVCPDELRLTTIIGVISVSFLALIFIPHWMAIFFVGSLVAVLYIDLLGFIQIAGLHVNPVMYISTVMSIGLMVDFVMHVTLMYVETTSSTPNRTEKTKTTLETIGASVLLGGFSTLIGVLPLALSTSAIFWSTFIIFFGLVLLGLLHGLVLLPVLLSMVGPLESISEEPAAAIAASADDEVGEMKGGKKDTTATKGFVDEDA